MNITSYVVLPYLHVPDVSYLRQNFLYKQDNDKHFSDWCVLDETNILPVEGVIKTVFICSSCSVHAEFWREASRKARPLRTPRRWVDNIKTRRREIGFRGWEVDGTSPGSYPIPGFT